MVQTGLRHLKLRQVIVGPGCSSIPSYELAARSHVKTKKKSCRCGQLGLDMTAACDSSGSRSTTQLNAAVSVCAVDLAFCRLASCFQSNSEPD